MTATFFLELGLNTPSARKIKRIADEVGAFLDGDFTLSSGQKTNHYFDGKKITLSSEGAYWVGKAIFDIMRENNIETVGGLTMGADPIVSAVAVIGYLEGRPISSFIVRDNAKEHGTKKRIEGNLKKGDRVAIVDDVITGGGSVLKAIEAVEAEDCEVVKVIVIVDRHEGGSDRLKEKGYDVSSILHLSPSGEVTVEASQTSIGTARSGLLR